MQPQFTSSTSVLPTVIAIVALAVGGAGSVSAVEVTLAANGKANMPVRVADEGERMQALGTTLSRYLAKISGATFDVKSGSNNGIVLQVKQPENLPVFDRERYSIRTNAKGIVLSGTTEDAVEHAVWDLLHRLGYRQFFPGETWEVVPQLNVIRLDLDVNESPDYHYRSIWYGYGTWDHNDEPWKDWNRKNRMGGSFQLRSGHAYGGIIRAKQAVFDQHPEFYALIDGKRHVRPGAKLCISNAALRQTVVDFAREYFEKNSAEDCVSMDPSDGGGWCECELCAKIGSPSDRALLLANQVAGVVKPRFVGMYAYNFHSAPPMIDVRPNVCINIATSFIKGGRTLDEIISGWSARGATIGIREYYSVNTWDRDLPGAARGTNLEYLAATISEFHAKGARFMSAESSDNWGCNGLGYYFASRALWNVDEVQQREAIVEDFLDNCFGPAKEPMRKFYELIDGSNKTSRLVYDDLLARMFRLLAEARRLVPATSQERERIDNLILYTRYVELFDRYRHATGSSRQQAFEQVIRHAYRIRRTMMVHAKGIYRDLPARDRNIVVPEGAEWHIAEDLNPWKSSKPFTDKELDEILAGGIAIHSLVELDFEPRSFGDDLVSAAPLKLAQVPEGVAARGRGARSWYTHFDKNGDIVLNITGGLIAHYRDRGHVQVSVWRIGGASETGERTTLVATDASVLPDGKPRTIRIPIKQPGLYRIDLTDGGDLTQVTWPTGQPMTWKMTLDDNTSRLNGRWHLWFYVPQGTTKIGLYVDTGGGSVLMPDGKAALNLEGKPGRFVSIDVPSGADGKLWKLNHVSGKVCLMNVPPYLARSPQELLLPSDVVMGE